MTEQELSLADYLKVVLRKKKFVFSVFLTFLIVAAGLSFFQTRSYRATTIIEIGYFISRATPTPTSIYKECLEGQVQLSEKIKVGLYNPKILEELKLELKEWPKIETTIPRDTYLVLITAQAQSPEVAEGVLRVLDKLILEDHQKIAQSLKGVEIIQPTKIIKEPRSSRKQGNFTLNLVVGGVLGLLLGILGAFCLDWWDKNQKKLKQLTA